MKKTVKCGNIIIGGGEPVSIQSMTNTKTTDVQGSLAQIRALEEAGCQ
ncbi:MAG: flavodoxin-dependent (E)-4-hydroxy-3-methylbut-2-enyl-diphosphate synthase, partial [Firmicutes bacterium]|nr:flavodoxin-dependent (E)-4-hydroxy-3-methylbut-2-enyl-diphosphate synthase [Bacillota bacterium]